MAKATKNGLVIFGGHRGMGKRDIVVQLSRSSKNLHTVSLWSLMRRVSRENKFDLAHSTTSEIREKLLPHVAGEIARLRETKVVLLLAQYLYPEITRVNGKLQTTGHNLVSLVESLPASAYVIGTSSVAHAVEDALSRPTNETGIPKRLLAKSGERSSLRRFVETRMTLENGAAKWLAQDKKKQLHELDLSGLSPDRIKTELHLLLRPHGFSPQRTF